MEITQQITLAYLAIFTASGLLLYFLPAKTRSFWYGYRTTRAMKSQAAWSFSQRYFAKKLLFCTAAFALAYALVWLAFGSMAWGWLFSLLLTVLIPAIQTEFKLKAMERAGLIPNEMPAAALDKYHANLLRKSVLLPIVPLVLLAGLYPFIPSEIGDFGYRMQASVANPANWVFAQSYFTKLGLLLFAAVLIIQVVLARLLRTKPWQVFCVGVGLFWQWLARLYKLSVN